MKKPYHVNGAAQRVDKPFSVIPRSAATWESVTKSRECADTHEF